MTREQKYLSERKYRKRNAQIRGVPLLPTLQEPVDWDKMIEGAEFLKSQPSPKEGMAINLETGELAIVPFPEHIYAIAEALKIPKEELMKGYSFDSHSAQHFKRQEELFEKWRQSLQLSAIFIRHKHKYDFDSAVLNPITFEWQIAPCLLCGKEYVDPFPKFLNPPPPPPEQERGRLVPQTME